MWCSANASAAALFPAGYVEKSQQSTMLTSVFHEHGAMPIPFLPRSGY
jgi:hypothetical protein